jgi:GPH family glycoside/pentoside/hexuronide:cation symporter
MQGPLPVRIGVLYAAGDIGPSLTGLTIALFWLFYLTDVAGLPVAQAGFIHGSGYAFSAVATLCAGHWLDSHLRAPRRRVALMVAASVRMSGCFALLWVRPASGIGHALWYLTLSWAFHLFFALGYLAYLSIGGQLAAGPQQRVQLNSFRFGGTMILSVLLLGVYAASGGRWQDDQRLLVIGALVAAAGAVGAVVCGIGLGRAIERRPAPPSAAAPAPWREVMASPMVWWGVLTNLAVWFVVQTVFVLTIFLCAAAAIDDDRILLTLQLSVVAATVLVSAAMRRATVETLLGVSAALWCGGALLWWKLSAPLAAAVVTGLGLGLGTILSWARLPEALDRHAAAYGRRVDARAYAALTVLRDVVTGAVPVLAGLALDGLPIDSRASGEAATNLLIAASMIGAGVVLAIRRPVDPAAEGAGTAVAPR